MGTSAAENIALLIESSADLSGITQSRDGITALGQAATAANAGVGDSALAAAADQEKLATLININVGAFEQLGKTVNTSSLAAVAAYRAQGDALSANLAKLGATEQELNRIGTAITRTERSSGAALLPPALPPAEVETLEKIPQTARRGADALSLMAFSAMGADGSVRSLVVSTGMLTSSMAQMSGNASLAASAFGLGALVVLLVTLVDLTKQAAAAMDDMNTPLGALSSTQQQHIANLKTEKEATMELALAQQAVARAQQQVADLEDEGGFLTRAVNSGQAAKALQQEADAIARVNALEERRGKIEKENADRAGTQHMGALTVAAADTSADGAARYQAQLAVIDAERDAAIKKGTLTQAAADEQATEKKRALLQSAFDYEHTLAQHAAEAQDALTKTTFDQRRGRADQEYEAEYDALQAKILPSEEMRTKLAADLAHQHALILAAIDAEQAATERAAKAQLAEGSGNPMTALKGKLAQIEIEKDAAIKAGVDIVTATLSAEQKKQAAIKETGHIFLSSLESAIAGGESYKKAVLETMLLPLEHYLEGIAEKEVVEAAASAAVQDWAGAARHAGVAALALAGAGVVASLGGLSGGGGGGGGGGAGSGGGFASSATSTTSAPASSAGATVINLYTTNPYSRENIQTAAYYLNRAGVLNRPIYLPPTTGLAPT